MKKIECNLDSYPQELECEGGKCYRYYTQLPMEWEARILKESRIDGDKDEFSLNTLILSLFRDEKGFFFFAFGCIFFDKICENEAILRFDTSYLRVIDSLNRNLYDSKGIAFKRNYYFNGAISLIKRLKYGAKEQ